MYSLSSSLCPCLGFQAFLPSLPPFSGKNARSSVPPSTQPASRPSRKSRRRSPFVQGHRELAAYVGDVSRAARARCSAGCCSRTCPGCGRRGGCRLRRRIGTICTAWRSFVGRGSRGCGIGSGFGGIWRRLSGGLRGIGGGGDSVDGV